jgi:hypothetical protein
MKISELGLPPSLFSETIGDEDTQARLVAPERLVSWAEEGRGDAIVKLCLVAYERRLADIDAWESERIRQLEEDLREDGDAEILQSRRYEHIKHYHTTHEDVIREAEMKRAVCRTHMFEHRAALERLVQEAREFIIAHRMRHEKDDVLAYILLSVTIFIAGYALFV